MIAISKETAEVCLDALERSSEELSYSLRHVDNDGDEASLNFLINAHALATAAIEAELVKVFGLYYLGTVTISDASVHYGAQAYPPGLIGNEIVFNMRFHSLRDALQHIADRFGDIGTDLGDWITNVSGKPGLHSLLTWVDEAGQPDADGFPVEIVWESPYSEIVDGIADESAPEKRTA